MQSRQGFTLIELLVVVAIIAILAAILFPVFARARAKAQQIGCLSNEKQMQTAWIMYASDYDNRATLCGVGGVNVYQRLVPYVKNAQVLRCPVDTAPATALCSYGYNHTCNGVDIDSIGEDSAGMVIFVDAIQDVMMPAAMISGAADVAPQPVGKLDPRHNGMCNATFVDGHAKCQSGTWFKPSMFNKTWTP